MFYEFAKLDLKLWGGPKAMAGIKAYAESDRSLGSLLGCWEVDVGELGRLLLLRRFESAQSLAEDRRQLLRSDDPYGTGEVLERFSAESFAPFPSMVPPAPGRHGAVYEFREYQMAVGGVVPSMQAWEQALPARQDISPVLVAMHALDGPPRLLHIVAYDSYEARLRLRKELYVKGLWPPKGAPEWIVKATSSLGLATPISALC